MLGSWEGEGAAMELGEGMHEAGEVRVAPSGPNIPTQVKRRRDSETRGGVKILSPN